MTDAAQSKPCADDITRLRNWISENRMTQGRLAVLLGEDRRLVRRWCSGAKPIPADVWSRLGTVDFARGV